MVYLDLSNWLRRVSARKGCCIFDCALLPLPPPPLLLPPPESDRFSEGALGSGFGFLFDFAVRRMRMGCCCCWWAGLCCLR